MSLVFTQMEIVNGCIKENRIGIPVFIHGDKKENFSDSREINGLSFKGREEDEEQSSGSSSIGAMSSSSSEDEEERGEEVQSKLLKDEGILGSLASLEESLPIKRGLSNFFSGKSKSFASLTEAASSCNNNARELAKQENPFNKRRRIHISCKASWRKRRASCASIVASFYLPLSTELVKEGVEEDEEGEEDRERATRSSFPFVPLPNSEKSFKNPRSYSLSDLQRL